MTAAETKEAVNSELCFCGREKRHRGRHRPVKTGIGKVGATITIRRPARFGPKKFAAIIVELTIERDKLDEAIRVLEAIG